MATPAFPAPLKGIMMAFGKTRKKRNGVFVIDPVRKTQVSTLLILQYEKTLKFLCCLKKAFLNFCNLDSKWIFKPTYKICENNYKTEKILYDALNACAEDEKCKMINRNSSNEGGPFTLCRNASYIEDTRFQTYSSFEKKPNG